MPVNHSRIISSVVSGCLALSAAACTEQAEVPTTRSTTQAVHGSGDAFSRMFGPLTRPTAILAAEVTAGQDRLCQMQADVIGDSAGNGLDDDDPDDSGWDFTVDTNATSHSTSASPSNTYGAAGLALLARGVRNRRALGCALDAALGMQARPEVDSPPDFVFWVLLGDFLQNPGFAELAAARYDAKVSEAGSAQAFGESIRDLRHSQGNDGLIGYDLAWLTFAAQGLHTAFPAGGYDGHAQTYATIIGNDLVSPTPLFDMEDGSEAFYTDGLSWSLLALHATDLLTELQGDLKELILATQLESGAWGFNGDFPEPDLQSTAGALLALKLAGTGADRPERRAAIRYLVDQQTEDGGWDYAPGDESPLANADVVFALGRTREPPAAPVASGRQAAAVVSIAPRASRALSSPIE